MIPICIRRLHPPVSTHPYKSKSTAHAREDDGRRRVRGPRVRRRRRLEEEEREEREEEAAQQPEHDRARARAARLGLAPTAGLHVVHPLLLERARVLVRCGGVSREEAGDRGVLYTGFRVERAREREGRGLPRVEGRPHILDVLGGEPSGCKSVKASGSSLLLLWA
jgi:hypothetical protein